MTAPVVEEKTSETRIADTQPVTSVGTGKISQFHPNTTAANLSRVDVRPNANAALPREQRRAEFVHAHVGVELNTGTRRKAENLSGISSSLTDTVGVAKTDLKVPASTMRGVSLIRGKDRTNEVLSASKSNTQGNVQATKSSVTQETTVGNADVRVRSAAEQASASRVTSQVMTGRVEAVVQATREPLPAEPKQVSAKVSLPSTGAGQQVIPAADGRVRAESVKAHSRRSDSRTLASSRDLLQYTPHPKTVTGVEPKLDPSSAADVKQATWRQDAPMSTSRVHSNGTPLNATSVASPAESKSASDPTARFQSSVHERLAAKAPVTKDANVRDDARIASNTHAEMPPQAEIKRAQETTYGRKARRDMSFDASRATQPKSPAVLVEGKATDRPDGRVVSITRFAAANEATSAKREEMPVPSQPVRQSETKSVMGNEGIQHTPIRNESPASTSQATPLPQVPEFTRTKEIGALSSGLARPTEVMKELQPPFVMLREQLRPKESKSYVAAEPRSAVTNREQQAKPNAQPVVSQQATSSKASSVKSHVMSAELKPDQMLPPRSLEGNLPLKSEKTTVRVLSTQSVRSSSAEPEITAEGVEKKAASRVDALPLSEKAAAEEPEAIRLSSKESASTFSASREKRSVSVKEVIAHTKTNSHLENLRDVKPLIYSSREAAGGPLATTSVAKEPAVSPATPRARVVEPSQVIVMPRDASANLENPRDVRPLIPLKKTNDAFADQTMQADMQRPLREAAFEPKEIMSASNVRNVGVSSEKELVTHHAETHVESKADARKSEVAHERVGANGPVVNTGERALNKAESLPTEAKITVASREFAKPTQSFVKTSDAVAKAEIVAPPVQRSESPARALQTPVSVISADWNPVKSSENAGARDFGFLQHDSTRQEARNSERASAETTRTDATRRESTSQDAFKAMQNSEPIQEAVLLPKPELQNVTKNALPWREIQARVEQALEQSRRRIVEPDHLNLSFYTNELGAFEIDIVREQDRLTIRVGGESKVVTMMEEEKIQLVQWMREQGHQVERVEFSPKGETASAFHRESQKQSQERSEQLARGSAHLSGSISGGQAETIVGPDVPSPQVLGQRVWTA
jgi:hypothetical protein